uniref:FAD-binding FR-type domain-containing protein n=1 Tax=Kwoniella dejecticola CBS 10117 TaxID=1296121 RepID=A0A1A6A026_9TREE|nr:uncharacterized protein I303_05683 [Kwoniella dejecticola CBS 10117]OBR83405.1 hypothetical protein I303_05683 [Kwoniella dejecticola CBS 10117]
MARLSMLTIWLIALLQLGLTSADKLQVYLQTPDYECVNGCYQALTLVSFKDITAKKPATADQCNSTSFASSLALCSEAYCDEKRQEAGWTYMTQTCKKSKVTLKKQATYTAQIDKNMVPQVDTIKDKKKSFNGTVLIDQHSWDIGYRTVNFADLTSQSHGFGFAVYLFMITAVIIGLVNRLISLSVHSFVKDISPEDANNPPVSIKRSRGSQIYTWWRKNVTLPAAFGYRHAQPWGWVSIPTRLQSILIFLFVAINVIFMCVGYDLFDENMSEPDDKQAQLLDYLQYRTGVMCVYNMPLLWMLAGRNDVILWVTGWSFSSINLWHRWVARMAVLQAFIHGVAYTIMKKDSLYERFFHRMYWATGIFALICFVFLVVLSIKPIRSRWYELFLITHIALALMSLVLLYFHLTHMKGKYNPWVWACVAVWCLDRAIRVARVLVLTHKALSKKGKNTVALMSDNESGLIRLSITTSIMMKPEPGQYYFIYQPFSIKPWENHPFTLASWKVDQVAKSTTLNFLVAPQKGITKKWRKRILKTEKKMDHTRFLLEGPYGHSNPIQNYEHVLLVAGGSGITSMLAYIHQLQNHREDLKQLRTKSITLVWVVKHIPYASDVLDNELKAFANNASAIPGIKVNIQLHISRSGDSTPTRTMIGSISSESSSSGWTPAMTRNNSQVDSLPPMTRNNSEVHPVPLMTRKNSQYNTSPTSTSLAAFSEKAGDDIDEDRLHHIPLKDPLESDEKPKAPAAMPTSGLTLHSGRPVMRDLVDTALQTLVGGERLAVSACGPARMVDDMRQAVVSVYGSEEGEVNGSTLEYFEELFSW